MMKVSFRIECQRILIQQRLDMILDFYFYATQSIVYHFGITPYLTRYLLIALAFEIRHQHLPLQPAQLLLQDVDDPRNLVLEDEEIQGVFRLGANTRRREIDPVAAFIESIGFEGSVAA